MSAEQVAALEQFKQLVHHSPLDIWIAALGVVVVFGLVGLYMAFQKAPVPKHREKWQLEEPRPDLWLNYFRSWWHVP
jgi:hypothetical protein